MKELTNSMKKDLSGLKENAMTDYEFNEMFNGFQIRAFFKNGYGISVIQHDYSYGHENGLFEAVRLNSKGHLDEDDVHGFLTKVEVIQMAQQISEISDEFSSKERNK